MNVLYIDTSSNKEIIVGIELNKKKDEIRQNITTQKAQVVLPLIDKLLKKHHLKLAEIDSINVNTGPGSFTGLRVGISIANALSFSLEIPINKKPLSEIVVPVYQ